MRLDGSTCSTSALIRIHLQTTHSDLLSVQEGGFVLASVKQICVAIITMLCDAVNMILEWCGKFGGSTAVVLAFCCSWS